MRLWHEDLIPQLPRPQLLGQHRECWPFVVMAGAESMRRLTMSLPTRLIVSMPIIA